MSDVTKLDSPEAEAKCERCGISCHGSVGLMGRNVVIEGLHCIYLKHTRGKWRCSVYKKRFEKAPWCLHTSEALPGGALRADCPYGENPHGKVRLSEAEYAKLWPVLSGILASATEVNENFTWDKFNRLASRRDPGYRWRIERSPTPGRSRVVREKVSCLTPPLRTSK